MTTERLSNRQIATLKHLAVCCANGGQVTLTRDQREAMVPLWRRELIEIWYRHVIAALLKTTQPNLEGMPVEERDALNFGPGSIRFVDLFYKLPRAQSLVRNLNAAQDFMRGSDE